MGLALESMNGREAFRKSASLQLFVGLLGSDAAVLDGPGFMVH